jgi:Skp family chaperone for outer membrane proteins
MCGPKGRQKGNTAMKKHHLKVLVPGIFAATALALAVGVGAQTPPPAPTAPAAKSFHATPMTGHHKDSAAMAKHDAEMKAECQAMEAKKAEMKAKLDAMDATLDNLVADMNAAKDSKEPDALEKPMAAVINELVVQRKASRAMRMEMQSEMMEHMTRHMAMHGAKGAMECPMMKKGTVPEPKS